MKFWPGCVALAIGGACLVACDPSRPDGAFTPDYRKPVVFATMADKDAGVRAASGQNTGDNSDTGESGDTGETDGTGATDDTSATEVAPRVDGGSTTADVTPAAGPLAFLEGKYLVRMDNYSSATATKDGTTLKVRNRLSNLFVVTLNAQDDHTLLAHEVMCAQTYWNACDRGCTTIDAWKTAVDPNAAKRFLSRVIDRTYSVDQAGKLVAGASAIALGFDGDQGGKVAPDVKLPTSKSDARVWHLDPSDSSDPAGVRTTISIHSLQSAQLAITQAVDCLVSTVQVYATAFSGQVDLTAKGGLDGKSFSLDTTGSQGQSIQVESNGAGSSTYCTKANIDGTTPADEISWVRFKRYPGTGVGCPADFESKFPGTNVSTQ